MPLIIEDDAPNDFFTSTDTPNTEHEYSCIECGVEIFYAGRGRKPRFCDNHKKSANPTSPTKTSGNKTNLIVANIEQFYIGIGVGLTFVNATANDGMVITQSANTLAESWRGLLDTNPKVRKYWERTLSAGGMGTVVLAHAMIAMPILRNHGLLPAKG